MATLTELENALVAADKSGNTDDAKMLAAEIRRRRSAGSYIEPIMQGLTFGFADELGGLGARIGRRLAGAPEERVEAAGEAETARQRQSLADIRERNPLGSAALEIGSSLLPGAGILRGVSALTSGRVLPFIATGAGEGALAGAGAADENKGAGALIGGALGAGLAGAVPAVGLGVQRGVEALQPLVSRLREGPATTASRILGETLEGAGMTPEALRARQAQLGPEAMLADIGGPATEGLGQAVIQADKTGQAVLQARRAMGERGRRSTERLRRDIAETTGVSGRLQSTLDDVRARQQAASGSAYAQAYAHDISVTPKLKNLLNRPPMQRAFKEAQDAAATRGEELPAFMRLDDLGDWEQQGVVPDMQAWDRMKQGVDRLIEREIDPVTGRMTSKGRDLTKMKQELVAELDDINPDYAEARRIFAGDEAIQNAMREGEGFLGMKTREVKSAVKDMNDSEREAFLTGAVEAIREKMGRAREGEIGQFRFLETGNVREKLRDIFPAGQDGDRQLSEMLRILDRERTFATTQGQIIGGSQTALRQAAGRALETGARLPTSTEALTNPGALIGSAMQKASDVLSRTSDKAVSELGSMLFDPGNVESVIAEMQRRGIPQEEIMRFVNRFSMGSAALSPYAGMVGGRLVGDQ